MKLPNSMSPIRAILFDLGEVLIRLDFSHILKLRELKPTSLAQAITSMNRWPLYDAYERGEMSEQQFLVQLNEELSCSLSLTEFRRCWNSVLGEGIPLIDPLLRDLKQNYLLYVLTNSNLTHIDYVRAHYPWLRHFNQVFTSYELGARKPERLIFERALQSIPVASHEILFLDDRLENVKGGRACGITSELCQRSEEDLPRIFSQHGIVCQLWESEAITKES